jgi:argininosuccinate lyase
MKLWDKGVTTAASIDKFTVGNDRELDVLLAPFDVLGSLAHVQMLMKIGMLDEQEYKSIRDELKSIYKEVKEADFEIPIDFEDIHSYVEFQLTERLGQTGKKLHTGRSRNDQVLTDLHLFMREELAELHAQTTQFFEQLLALSEEHKEKLLPGYTHLQVAMPSSFGLWFGAYAETLIEDLRMLQTAYATVDQNPLGSAAGYGTSFPLDRELTTNLLGFSNLKVNAAAAQISRGIMERNVSWALAAVGSTVGKMAMDLCLFSSQNFNFVGLPAEFTTGSSIMPHKQNPDVLELVRAKCNVLQTLPLSVTSIITNLTSGYHRDFQLIKEQVLPAFETLKACLNMMQLMLKNIEVNTVDLTDEKYRYLFTVEEVNKLVESGTPFRDAYKIVGGSVQDGTFESSQKVAHTHIGSIGNLRNDLIVKKMEDVARDFKPEAASKVLYQLV